MNKTRVQLHRANLMLIVASVAIAWFAIIPGNMSAAGKPAPAPAQKTQAAGRLVIVRSASLGPSIIGLKIDGVKTAQMAYNRRYDAQLTAGAHVLTVYPVFSVGNAQPTETRLTVEPGKTYTFTATRQDIQIVLK